MRICIKCNQELPIENFRNDSRYPGARRHVCRQCDNKARYVRNIENNRRIDPYKTIATIKCRICKQELPATDFYKCLPRSNGLDSRCKDCAKIEHKKHRTPGGDAKQKAQAILLKKTKRLIVIKDKQKGCSVCGYSRCLDALEYHHYNGDKLRCISRINTPESVRKEMKKCVLLCANCHRELHNGMLSVNDNGIPAPLPKKTRTRKGEMANQLKCFA